MSSSSTVCDMLTAVRNGIALRKQTVDVVDSRLNRNVLDALKRAGYIWDLSQVDVDGRSRVRVVLKYGPDGSSVMRSIVSVSKPGNRVYSRVDRIPFVLQGL
ncbi:MAG: 30S ribosomal protein S8, partial [Planctomycetes bacterium]|nr:30S ribosomal protein S8 [Planctomycetota bacterium]